MFLFFFFNDTATTEIYTLSLHDALPISRVPAHIDTRPRAQRRDPAGQSAARAPELDVVLGEPLGSDPVRHVHERSEEHTSELQSRQYLVCRLLLEKKKKNTSKSQEIIRI